MMKCWKAVFLFVIFLITIKICIAQKPLEGNWYSNGIVNIDGSTNSYLGELKLKQNGRTVFGEFNYYFRDSLFKTNIQGIYDQASRYVIFNSFPVILHSSTSTKTGVDCSMSGEFMLRISRVGSYMAGKFIADKEYRYTCPDISFDFERNTGETNPIEEAKAADSIAKVIPVEDDPIVVATKKDFDERPKNFFKEIAIESKDINIEFYDNGVIDYDSISVFLNSKLILKKTMLTHTAIKLHLNLDDSLPFNELGMFANNEGLIPPNTATLIINDGLNREELELNSSLHSTATIRLVKKKIK